MLKNNKKNTKNSLKEKMKEIKKIDDNLFEKEKAKEKHDDQNNDNKNKKKNKNKQEEKIELFSDDNVEIVELNNNVKSSKMVKNSKKSTLTKDEILAKEKKVDEKIQAEKEAKKQNIIENNYNNINNNNNENYNDIEKDLGEEEKEYNEDKEDTLFNSNLDYDVKKSDSDTEEKLGSEKFVTQRLETITDEMIEEKKKQEAEKDKVQKSRIEKLSKKGIEAISKRFKITDNYMKDLKNSMIKDAISIILSILLFVITYYLCRNSNLRGDKLKIIAVILEIISITILETSYRKEHIGHFIRGIEISAISYIYIYFINMLEYVNAGKKTYISLIISIILYYIIKMILTKNIIKDKNYNKYIDIREITEDNIDNE